MAYSNTTGLASPSDVLRPYIDATYFTEESRERGTAVHQACADHLLGRYVVIDRQYRGYYDSFRRWCDNQNPVCMLVEKRLVDNTYGFCGQPDFVGTIKYNGILPGVVDFKTSVALGRAWPLQIAAYQRLAEVKFDQIFSWGASVRLDENGDEPQVDYYNNYEYNLNIFLGLLNGWKHFNQ